MNIEKNELLRFQFLARVVDRECRQLRLSKVRVFSIALTIDRIKSMDDDPLLSEQIEAFVSRFSRLQDTLGDKLLPHLLFVLGEKKAIMVDNLV